MTLQQLNYVCKIATCNSISMAAEELYISQPALTKALHELEEEIGIIIFQRTNKGIVVSKDGEIFLGYARQVLDQTSLIEEKYIKKSVMKQQFCVSTQHYSFAVNAFVDMIKHDKALEYDFSLIETETYEIIRDVKLMRSEIGILYINDFNKEVILKILKAEGLVFNELFVASPHVFISDKSELSKKDIITLDDLKEYPYLSYVQGDHNSFYFSEEIFTPDIKQKNIRVRDRATLFNLIIGLNGYTTCSGVIDEALNGKHIIARPLDIKTNMHIGYITNKDYIPSRIGKMYLESLSKYIKL